MNRRISALILSCIATLTITGCGNSKKEVEQNIDTKQVEEIVDLPGTWAANYTREEVTAIYNSTLERVEKTVLFYGLNDIYEIVNDKISNEDDRVVNSSYIYLDIENPEINRLESMYYGFKQFGSNLATGQISMKLSMNLDKETYISNGNFKFEETSLAKFSEAFTNVENRDYTTLNEQIFSIINGSSQENTIETNLDGIKETISIIDDFIIYRLDTKEYIF